MAIVLDAPQESPITGAAEFLPAIDSADAIGAAELLEGGVDEGPSDPQITIRLVRLVEDPVVHFSGAKDETFTACIDADGDVYIPFGEHEICLEAEDFEVVETAEPEVTAAAPEIQPGESGVIVAPDGKLTELVVSDSLAQVAPDDGSAASDREATQSQLPESIGGSGDAGQAAVGCVSDTTSDGDTVQYGSGQRPSLQEPTPFERYQDEKQALEEQLSDLVREGAHLKERAKSAKKAAEVVAEEIDELVAKWESGEYEAGLEAEKRTTKPEATPGAAGGADATVIADPSGKAERPGLPPGAPASPPAAAGDMTARLRVEHAEQERYRAVLEAATIGELGLPPKVEEKLQEAGATNIWRLEQLRSEISQNREKWRQRDRAW